MDVSSYKSIQIGIPESSCAAGWGVPNRSSKVTRLMLTTGEGNEAKSGAGRRQTGAEREQGGAGGSRREQKRAEEEQERAERNQRGRSGRAKRQQLPRSRESPMIGEYSKYLLIAGHVMRSPNSLSSPMQLP
jgi:hypothetical protein